MRLKSAIVHNLFSSDSSKRFVGGLGPIFEEALNSEDEEDSDKDEDIPQEATFVLDSESKTSDEAQDATFNMESTDLTPPPSSEDPNSTFTVEEESSKVSQCEENLLKKQLTPPSSFEEPNSTVTGEDDAPMSNENEDAPNSRKRPMMSPPLSPKLPLKIRN